MISIDFLKHLRFTEEKNWGYRILSKTTVQTTSQWTKLEFRTRTVSTEADLNHYSILPCNLFLLLLVTSHFMNSEHRCIVEGRGRGMKTIIVYLNKYLNKWPAKPFAKFKQRYNLQLAETRKKPQINPNRFV